ncbi:protein of unknown function [Nitrospira japonica]|uniref:Uncharacterized protein n=1 Tax=Nitrospira japonica TaxID=1325564 RepID=A0A1W1I358_9BACT|nr:protein of unknown function [Nitrospira japonica]
MGFAIELFCTLTTVLTPGFYRPNSAYES